MRMLAKHQDLRMQLPKVSESVWLGKVCNLKRYHKKGDHKLYSKRRDFVQNHTFYAKRDIFCRKVRNFKMLHKVNLSGKIDKGLNNVTIGLYDIMLKDGDLQN